jgi:Fe-S-cluster-containing dehydrogenase component
MDVSEQTRGVFPNLHTRYFSQPCMQCELAPCMEAYPEAIYKRPDGILIIDPTVQTDEGIVDSCPYGRIYYNEELGIGQKCTFCAHRIDEGKNPKCVDACPLKVIHFGDLDDPTSEVRRLIDETDAKPLNPEFGAAPKVFYSAVPTPVVAGRLMDSRTCLDIEGATATIRSLTNGQVQATESDKAGNFAFENLSLGGIYSVTIEAPGCYTRKRFVFLKGDGYQHLGILQLFPR